MPGLRSGGFSPFSAVFGRSFMEITRRTFLFYIGAVGSLAALETTVGCSLGRNNLSPVDKKSELVGSATRWTFSQVPYPLPLPRDTTARIRKNGWDSGIPRSEYEINDTLTVPEGYTWRVLAKWGDVFGPTSDSSKQIRFGYNCDYTALIPRRGKSGEFWLCVNHEYVSLRPWQQGYRDVYGTDLPELKVVPNTKKIIISKPGEIQRSVPYLDISKIADSSDAVVAARILSQSALEEMGVSILHVKSHPDGSIHVISDSPDHKRITTTQYINCALSARPTISGPVRLIVEEVHGTACNCSGGTTPWGSLLTCEENIQDMVAEYVTPEGKSFPPPFFTAEGKGEVLSLPVGWQGAGAASDSELDSRSFGWVTEIDPETGDLVKHSSLGRFRHENITLHVAQGSPLVAYMGDDRRGGHVWKFKSDAIVESLSSPSNSRLFEKGVLYAAKFDEDFSGHWIPLLPETKLVVPQPGKMAGGMMILPSRPEGGGIRVTDIPSGEYSIRVESYIKKIEDFTGKKFSECVLGDLIKVPENFRGDKREYQQAVILLDAHRMANAVGATPCARPEDLEFDQTDQGVFIAFTEASGSDDGSPDASIFVDSRGESSREYGAIFKIYESQYDTFVWKKLISSGEVSEGGSGLACADNLALDQHQDLWVVCDITTMAMNKAVSRTGKSTPGSKGFLGIFGSSSLFRFQRTYNGFSYPECFAIGPVECELTGPTFTPDGSSLIISVQHPGEHNGTRGFERDSPLEEKRSYQITSISGEVVKQERVVPLGSNFPHGLRGKAPQPCVVVISRKN